MTNDFDFTNDAGNDPFDEFEFKPLTEGLGFHKKVEFKTNTSNFEHPLSGPSTMGVIKNPMQRPLDIPTTPSKNSIRPTMHIPNFEDDSITKAQTAVNEILKNLNQKKQTEENLKRNTPKKTWVAAAPSLSAGFLDAMLIVAFFLLSLIFMLVVTKVDLISNLSQPDPQFLIYWATTSLLAAIQLIYFVSCRAFLGCTPGEWAFDQRCGNEVQMASSSYILKVMVRSLFNIATGFIVIPVLSAVAKFDILAAVSGVQVQRQMLSNPAQRVR